MVGIDVLEKDLKEKYGNSPFKILKVEQKKDLLNFKNLGEQQHCPLATNTMVIVATGSVIQVNYKHIKMCNGRMSCPNSCNGNMEIWSKCLNYLGELKRKEELKNEKD